MPPEGRGGGDGEPPAVNPTQPSILSIYELRIAPGDLRQLERNPFSSDTHPGVLTADGVTYDPVRVRFRGQWARSWPKKGFKIFFDKEHRPAGHHSLNLNSGWRDPAFIREVLAYHVFAACGVPAPQARVVRLQVNGRFRGAYIEVEQPDKGFLERCHLKGALLYKATSNQNRADERDLGSDQACAVHYESESRKADGMSPLQRFCHELATTSDPAAFFDKNLDVDRYINYLAAAVLVQHWDGYNKNHFIGCDLEGSGKWFVVPWDLDRTFGDHWEGSFHRADLPVLLGTHSQPGVTGWNRLQDRFLGVPALRTRFLSRLRQLLETEFTAERLLPFLDSLESRLGSDVALDRRLWPGGAGDFHAGVAGVRNFIQRRREFLWRELARLQRGSGR